MGVPLIGEVQMFAGNYAPDGWAFCDGSILNIADNTALYSLLGDAFGGDGRTTFGLPDLRGRIAIGAGHQPGGADYARGQKAGSERVTLDVAQMPLHLHNVQSELKVTIQATTAKGDTVTPTDGVLLCTGYDVETAFQVENYQPTSNAPVALGGTSMTGKVSIANAGKSASHENMMPYQCVNYIIAVKGIYPERP